MHLLLKSSSLLPHQAKDFAHITHFIHYLHSQHYVLGKNLTLLKNAITQVQKKDTELYIFKGLHNHDTDHKINNISGK